jgi:putative exporter of polyketide antibiotics
LTQLGPLFKWPAWVDDISVFFLYGTPLTSGVYWTGLWILLGVTAVALAIGLLSFQRRDIGR